MFEAYAGTFDFFKVWAFSVVTRGVSVDLCFVFQFWTTFIFLSWSSRFSILTFSILKLLFF